ncbi:MAG: Penicillin-binding protein 1A [Rhodocyclaceae bacterium]|jgi:penicillin-binding protein 1A|nr:Penicillin-binding protein 1A [Rhodocyclaceae bacterium]
MPVRLTPPTTLSPVIRRTLLALLILAGLLLSGLALVATVTIIIYPQLPSLAVLTDYRPKIPLRIYSADGALIGEFGEERRSIAPIATVPPVLKLAILAAEDERFYQHPGVDTLGLMRAAVANLTSGGRQQGASTITMQVARNFFLSSEKTLTRKVYEVLLAFKIENNLTKDRILELYINQIYLGQRAYGFAAAAQIYFGKELRSLTLAEAAMLAGLPKAPSSYNPIANPKRARLRQHYVLRRMHELGWIDDATQKSAQQETLRLHSNPNEFAVNGEYIAEMARQIAYERFKEATYTSGLRVITTIRQADQAAAVAAVMRGVLDYDRRHGYRGAEGYIDLPKGDNREEAIEDALQPYAEIPGLPVAVILEARPTLIKAYVRGGNQIDIPTDGLKFARAMLDDKSPTDKRLRTGAVIRVAHDARGTWQVVQLPQVEAAFISADPRDGAVRALVGGFDFGRNQFNHATQAWRQPGSSFKPFIYSAALEKGFHPGSVIEDAPFVVPASETGSTAWAPQNYDGKYEGPMTLRMALAKSKNMVSIRLLSAIGPRYAQEYATRFGFDADKHPPYLTMALGAGAVTPWQMLRAYSTIANGGYRVEPYLVAEIRDQKDRVLARFNPRTAGDEALRAIDARNAYVMDSLMQEVVRRGTAAKAMVLQRSDLAGKTGTTNDFMDAWFCGYQPALVAIAWVGFDQPRSLGQGETGGAVALPIWIGYMSKALQGIPETRLPQPEGLITASPPAIDPHVRDYLYREHMPPVDPFSGSTSP